MGRKEQIEDVAVFGRFLSVFVGYRAFANSGLQSAPTAVENEIGRNR